MKSYKILRVAGLHYVSLMRHLDKTLSGNSYEELKKEIFSNFHVYSDSFSYGMNRIGQEADEIIYDYKLLQKKWAEENSIKFSKDTWRRDVLFAQIIKSKPDILYFQDVHALAFDDFCNIKKHFSFVKKIVIFRGYPGLDDESLKKISTADIVFIGSPILKSKLEDHNIKPYLVYHFFDERILQKLLENQKLYELTFIGTSGYGYGRAHLPRYIMLTELLKRTEIKLWVDEVGHKLSSKAKQDFRNFLKRLLCKNDKIFKYFENFQIPRQLANLVEEIKKEKECLKGVDIFYPLKPLSNKYKDRCFNPVFGLEMFQTMASSKITLNRHSLAAGNFSDNIRMFQATGVGSCLITEKSENLNQLFEEDSEVVTYSSTDECIEKVNYLLKNESLLKSIAQKGQQRTLKFHTSTRRAEEINDIIQSTIKK